MEIQWFPGHMKKTQRMIAEAEGMGANAVINVRYEVADCVQGSAEAVIAYGTAVTYA